MSENETTTRNLSKVLEKVQDNSSAEEFVASNAKDLPPLHVYLDKLIRAKNLDRTAVINHSGISKNYVYNILNGNKTNPGRDKVIALCVAIHASYKETQRALEITGLAPLYPRDERDIRISVAINNEIGDVTALNILLDEYKLAPLDV